MESDPAAKDKNTNQSEEIIILCPPASVSHADPAAQSSLENGFKAAHSVVSAGHPARLIAHGCIFPSSQPDWVIGHPNFSVSELGDYRLGDPIEQTRTLSRAIRSWLDRIFAPAAAGQAASRIFYGSLAGRILQPMFDAIPYVHGLAKAHPNGNFIITDTTWQGTDLLRSLIEPSGGRIMSKHSRRVRLWRLRFTMAFLYTLVRGVAGQLKNYALSKKSRNFLSRHARGEKPEPKIWLALVPDWERVNRHVIDRIAQPLFDRKIPFGIALITTLAPGERTIGMKEQLATDDTPWPMLDIFKPNLARIPIEQLVRPPSLAGLFQALVKGCLASLQIGWRLLRQGPYLDFGPYRVAIHMRCRPIAALATTDVLSVTMTTEAFTELSARHDFTDSKVVFSSVGAADSAAADHSLRQSGATTVNFVHGALGDGWYGQTENCSDHMMVWTHSDVANCRSQGASAIFFPPRLSFVSSSIDHSARNILFVTNYLHHDWTAAHYPLKPFLLEMLRSQKLIEEDHPGVFRFRWRPHPSDVRTQVNYVASLFPDIELSREELLEEDFSWADIAIVSPSTTILNALAADLPVFVQCPPAQRNLPDMQAITKERKFFSADELRAAITDLVNRLSADRSMALKPDHDLYRNLIGSEQAPADIERLLVGSHPNIDPD